MSGEGVEVTTCGSPICTDIGKRYSLMKKLADPLSLDKSSSSSLISALALGVCNDLTLNISTEKKIKSYLQVCILIAKIIVSESFLTIKAFVHC